MGELVLTNPFIKLGTSAAPSTDLWGYIRQITINYSAEIMENTPSGNTSRKRIVGLKDSNVSIEWNQDFADGTVDDQLFALVGLDSSNCWMEIRPTTAAAGASNPRYHGRFLLESYSPLGQSIGEVVTAPTNFLGDGDLTRAES